MGQVIQLAPFMPAAPAAPARVSVVAVESRHPAVRTDAVYVVFTSTDETLAAMRTASDLARTMAVPLTLLHFRTVPYPAPVDVPTGVSPVETEAFKSRLLAEGIDATIRVYLCRDGYKAASQAFKPHSLIVFGGRRHAWWKSQSRRLRHMLETNGHAVVFVDEAAHKEHSHA